MLDLLETYMATNDATALCDGVDSLTSDVESMRRNDRGIVARAEAIVKANPDSIVFDETGAATLTIDGHTWSAGRFTTPTLDGLRERAMAKREAAGRSGNARLWVLNGVGSAFDIGALQAHGPDESLYQVASQLNCLEAMGPHIAAVASYFGDPTQGPRAAVSAFPATLSRHYRAPAPDGSRFVQTTNGRQIELLSAVCRPGVAQVESGYLSPRAIVDPGELARRLVADFGKLRVGVHDDLDVVLGDRWDGAVPHPKRIAQVFTSTVAAGQYGTLGTGEVWTTIVRQLQRAAYLGTLAAAAAAGKKRVVLTLIGGGAFENPKPIIWESMLWALDEVAPLLSSDLTVAVNARGELDPSVGQDALLAATRARGGGVLGERAGRAVLIGA